MATRRERVILDLEDNFTKGTLRAAAAAGVLDGALNDLDGSGRRASKGLDDTSRSTKRVGDESRKAGPDIDKYSGRLRTLADAAITLGPAILPLGAAAIPALTSALAGLGAAAGGIGVTVLALHGIGDGLKAIDAAQLDPTAENLMALRIEMEKLGPAGAQFAHFLDDLEPKLNGLQQVARAGLFPGLEDGITAMLTRLPEVRTIVAELATGMGDLAREAGTNLAGGKFDAFFQYLETDARPTLEAFGHATGNVVEGLSNLFVAFAPMNRDFTQGLVGASEAFAKWSRSLDTNQGFQHFLAYIRESGPQAMQFLEAVVKALAGLAEAAAPYGRVVLPVLTGLANAFSAIASSDLGPPLFAAAAAMLAFNRAATITAKTSKSLKASFAEMGTGGALGRGIAGIALLDFQLTGLNDKLALSNTAMDAMAGFMIGGPWGAAVGGGIGLVQDFQQANDGLEASIQRADDAMASFDTSAMQASLHDLLTQVDAIESTKLFGGGFTQDAKDALSLGSLPLAFANSTGKRLKSLFVDLTGGTDDAKAKIAELTSALNYSGKTADGFGGIIDAVSNTMEHAAHSASGLSAALAELNGWFDKRQALRDYRDGIDALSKGLKNGFGRKDVENLDAAGRNILQVANDIKDPALKRDFLQSARGSLEKLANTSGPKAAAAIQRVIDKFDSTGLTHPPHPKLDVDTKAADSKIDGTTVRLHKFGNTVAIAKATVDDGGAVSAINQVTTMLRNLNGTTATTYVRTVRSDIPLPGRADGGQIFGPGGPRDDKILARLSNREYVMPVAAVDHYGVGMMDAIRARRFADGGTPARRSNEYANGGPFHAINEVAHAAHEAAKGLKGLKKQAEELQKANDKAKQARDAALSKRNDLSSSIQQGLMGDSIFAGSTGSVFAAGQYGPNTPQGAIAALNARKERAQQFVAAVNTLRKKGVSGPALLEILNEGLDATVAMAAADIGTLRTFSAAENQANQALAAAGLAGGNAVYGGDVKATQAKFDKMNDRLREIKQEIRQANHDNQKAQKDTGQTFTLAVNGAAANGHRRGKH